MTARLLRPTISLVTLLLEIRYTLSRLAAAKLFPASLAKMQALRDAWTAVQAKDISLQEQLSDAGATIDAADDALDDFAVRFSNAILALTKQNTKAALYTHYFKKPLGELIRPTLSGQLVTMAGWITSLQEPTAPPSLVAMLPELEQLVAAGKAAEAAREGIRLQNKQFREVGERRQLVDQVNAERKELFGLLSRHAVQNSLPAGFAGSFFKPGEAGEEEVEESVASCDAEIQQLTALVEEKRARRAELAKAEEEAAKRAESRASKEAQLAAMEQEIEERQKAARALAEEIERG